MKKYAVIAALITSASVYADPIYLKCSISSEETDEHHQNIEVRLDESNGKVSHSTDALVFNADGIWSAEAIRYKYMDGTGGPLVPILIQAFKIDRSTLKMTKTITIEYPKKFNTPDDLLGPYSGDCTIVETAENKI